MCFTISTRACAASDDASSTRPSAVLLWALSSTASLDIVFFYEVRSVSHLARAIFFRSYLWRAELSNLPSKASVISTLSSATVAFARMLAATAAQVVVSRADESASALASAVASGAACC